MMLANKALHLTAIPLPLHGRKQALALLRGLRVARHGKPENTHDLE
jgi:hypothetical protein